MKNHSLPQLSRALENILGIEPSHKTHPEAARLCTERAYLETREWSFHVLPHTKLLGLRRKVSQKINGRPLATVNRLISLIAQQQNIEATTLCARKVKSIFQSQCCFKNS